jgi:hypothetical protein
VVGAGSGEGPALVLRLRAFVWSFVSGDERREAENLLRDVRKVWSSRVVGRGWVVRVKDVGC